MGNSQINKVELEQKLNSEQMPINTTVSPTIAKPHVGCSASLSEKVEQILTIVNGLSLNDAELVIRESSIKINKYMRAKTNMLTYSKSDILE